MAKLTKRMKTIRSKVEVTKEYEINEAVALLKELATAKFVESVTLLLILASMLVNQTKTFVAQRYFHMVQAVTSALQCSLKVQTLKQLKKLAQILLVWEIFR